VQPFSQSIVRPRLQAGVSNLQIMIGTLIGGILIMGGIAMLGQIEKAKADNEVRELSRLKKKTVSLAAQRGSFSGVTSQTVIALDFFPPEMVSGPIGSRVVQNQWSGTIDVTPAAFPTANDTLMYRYTGVSASACKQLGMAAGSVASGIMVQGTWVKSTVAINGSADVNQQALIANCDQGANNVTIDFYLTK
jgi:hypothetical protein